MFLVRAIENHPTSQGDVPTEPCTIVDCGQLDPSDPSLEPTAAADGDPYEDYPEDQEPLSDGDVANKPEVALRVAREIREIGNQLFKEKQVERALEKYQSKYYACIFPNTKLIYTCRGYSLPRYSQHQLTR